MNLRFSARDLNKSLNILKSIKDVGDEEFVAGAVIIRNVIAFEETQDLIKWGCKYPIIHVESIEEKIKRFKEYETKAQRIVVSAEWRSFLSELQNKCEESSRIFVILPRKCGKTQLAYNLSHDYFVIHFDCGMFHRKDFSITREAVSTRNNFLSLKWTCGDSSFLCSFLDQLFAHCLRSKHFKQSHRFMHFFDNLSKFSWNQKWIIDIDFLKEKYSSELLKSFIFFFDDYNTWVTDDRLGELFLNIVTSLGCRVIFTSFEDTYYTRPRFLDHCRFDVIKSIAKLEQPLPYLLKFYKFAIDENILLQKYMEQTIGPEDLRMEFFIFLMEQISSSVPFISEAIIKSLIDFCQSFSEPIPYEKWRDKYIRSTVEYLADFVRGLKEPGVRRLFDDFDDRGDLIEEVLNTSLMDGGSNIFAYFYELIYAPIIDFKLYTSIWDKEPLERFICRASLFFSNDGIQKKSLNTFLQDILRGMDLKFPKTEINLHLPEYLREIYMAFYPRYKSTWPDRLHKVFPNMLADWHLDDEHDLRVYTFEYFENEERKKGKVLFGCMYECTKETITDVDLCIRLTESRTFEYPRIAVHKLREIITRIEKRFDEIKRALSSIPSQCDCCFPKIYCDNCQKIVEYYDEVLRMFNFVTSTLNYDGPTYFVYHKDNDREELRRLIREAKREYIKKWKSDIKSFIPHLDESFDHTVANVFLLVDEFDGRYHFENISTTEGSKKTLLILPILGYCND